VLSATLEARGTFLRARLASLLAVAPLGAWTIAHLWNNLAAFQGRAAWQAAVTEHPSALSQLFVGILVLLPLALHTAWGLGRLWTSQPNNLRYGTYANLKYALQRLSAVGLLFFLGAHVWLAMLEPRLLHGHAEAFEDIAHEMRFHAPTLVVYVLGVLAVAYHLVGGLQSFALGWGVVASRRALQRLEAGALVAFFTLLAMGWSGIYALWTAGAAGSP
jgi:succinate dehydrogenase / fumarate reductase cytochrome b subunit